MLKNCTALRLLAQSHLLAFVPTGELVPESWSPIGGLPQSWRNKAGLGPTIDSSTTDDRRGCLHNSLGSHGF